LEDGKYTDNGDYKVRNGKRFNMIKLDNFHLYQELVIYKKRADRTGYTNGCNREGKVKEKAEVCPMEDYFE
jgi:hypothetical protein